MAIMKLLRDVVQHWFSTDRVRVSPTVGRMLALSPGDRFEFGGEVYRVQSRQVLQSDSTQQVIFELDGSAGHAQLHVRQASVADGQRILGSSGELIDRQRRVCIHDDEIALLNLSATKINPQ